MAPPLAPRALEPDLAAALPGFTVLDRDLTLRDGPREVRAACAGLDALGRLWLVLVAVDDPARALLDALALLAFAGEHRAALAGAAEETRVAIVCESGGDELARRAAPVTSIDVFVRETWSSANGEHTRLVRRGAGTAEAIETPARFLGRLAERERGLAELCLARVTRLAPGVEVRAGADRIAWGCAGRELGQLALRERGLEARAGRGGASVALASEVDVERWLASVLDEHLGAATADDGLAPLPESDPRPGPGGVLLTPEELAAFSD